MVFSQLGILKKPFFEQILCKRIQLWNVCNNFCSFTIYVHHDQINYRPLIEYKFLRYLLLQPNKSTIYCKNNEFISSKKCQKIFLYQYKEVNLGNLTKFHITNSSHSINNIPTLLQKNEDDQNDVNIPILYFHQLWRKIQDNKHELWKKSKNLQQTKEVFHSSSNYKFKYTSTYRGLRIQLQKGSHQIYYNSFFSSLEGNDVQTNSKKNNDAVAKELEKDVEKNVIRAKTIHDEDLQTISQLEVLKTQVKKVHEEMQAKKHESWTIKFGKFVNSIGNFIKKFGPGIKSILSMSRQDWNTKIVGWKNIIKLELQHYWIGGKLLWTDIKISNRLLYKVLSGMNLTRRERQQLKRTIVDIFRLIPFAIILIVPFMEFTLPFLLKVFPNMLPSTFVDKNKEKENVNTKLVARVQYAKFLKETVQDMAKELKKSPSGELRRNASELENFMNKVHTRRDITNKEIVAFAKLFNDELTLDNISRPRLVSMCKYMNIQPYGTDAYLRYSLHNKLLVIKKDDKEIEKEGIDSLSEFELRIACRERGMLGIQSIDKMRVQLRDWLDLSIVHKVPSSLLILSRAFLVAGKTDAIAAIEATLSSLPNEVIASVDVSTKASELELEERMKRLEILQQQEELIKKGK